MTVTVPASAITTAPATVNNTTGTATAAATTPPVATTAVTLPTVTKAPANNSAATPTATVVDAPTMTAAAKPPSTPVASGPGKLVYESGEPQNVIYAVNPDGTGKTKIADGRTPVLSPDGKRVAYVRVTSGELGVRPFKSVIEVANLDGSGKQQLCTLKENYVVGLLRWSPRERFIAYREAPSNTDGIPQIGQCSTADKQIAAVKRTQGDPVMLYDWSPDGDNALWLAGPDLENLKLYYGDPDKGGQGAVEIAKGLYRIGAGPFSTDYNTARFLPDGKTIAVSGSKLFFISVPGQKSPLEGKVIDLGSETLASAVAFSPDGKTIAAIIYGSSGYPSLKLIDLSDKNFGKVSDLPNSPIRATSVDWSRQ
jgi:Tol biopolymer transport system component